MKIETVTIDLPGCKRFEIDLWRHAEKIHIDRSWKNESWRGVEQNDFEIKRNFWLDKHYDVDLKEPYCHWVITRNGGWGAVLELWRNEPWLNLRVGQLRIQSVHAKAGVVVRRDNNNDNAIVHFFEMMTEW